MPSHIRYHAHPSSVGIQKKKSGAVGGEWGKYGILNETECVPELACGVRVRCSELGVRSLVGHRDRSGVFCREKLREAGEADVGPVIKERGGQRGRQKRPAGREMERESEMRKKTAVFFFG